MTAIQKSFDIKQWNALIVSGRKVPQPAIVLDTIEFDSIRDVNVVITGTGSNYDSTPFTASVRTPNEIPFIVNPGSVVLVLHTMWNGYPFTNGKVDVFVHPKPTFIHENYDTISSSPGINPMQESYTCICTYLVGVWVILMMFLVLSTRMNKEN